jgi:hypothetical protein
MTKPHPKPSDRGRNSPEPGPTPGTRAEQRDTDEQITPTSASGDQALAWERDEQEKLPPRGAGSQHNQGEDKGPTLHAGPPRVEEPLASVPPAGLHTGGTRGPSNDNQ